MVRHANIQDCRFRWSQNRSSENNWSWKTRFTVVLACLADGTKLKPMVIFKRKTMPKDNFPAGVVVHNHPKGWMDESGVKIWIEKVWRARPGGFANTQSLLVWDSFSAHLTDTVKQQLCENKTATAVIPGGLTSLVQPLDVYLNKPFKNRLREKWMTWMMSGEKTFTLGGQLRAASLVTVCQWVKESWQELSRKWWNALLRNVEFQTPWTEPKMI